MIKGLFTAALGLIPGVGPLLAGAVSFFSSPLGRWVGAGLIAVGIWVSGDLHGRFKERADNAAAQQRAEIAAKQRDLDQGEIAADDDDARLASILKNSTTNRERIDAFKTELASRQNSACRLTADDVAGLRLDGPDSQICGHAAAGAKGHAARSGTVLGRDCKAVLADYRGALREANARICAGNDWYRGVKSRYGKAPLK